MDDKTTVHPVGPGVVAATAVTSGPPVTGMATFPPPQASLRVAAQWLNRLDGAELANWQEGGVGDDVVVFVLGHLADDLTRVADRMDAADAAIRRARAATDDLPGWRRWLRDQQPGFKVATSVYKITEWIGDRYRSRYGDDDGWDE